MARRRAGKEQGPQRDPTRALFLSLNMILLAFFILLVALSQPDEERQAEVALRVREAFQSFGGAYLSLGPRPEQRGVQRQEEALETSRTVEQFLGELSRFIERSDAENELSYEIRSEGLTIHISQDFAFRPGSAELREAAEPLLESLYGLVLRTTNRVRIEGHSDDQEIRTSRYTDAWELSAARAMTVFRLLTRTGELPQERFSVAGYGPTRPRATNLTEEGRAMNRRVSVTLVGELEPLQGAEGQP